MHRLERFIKKQDRLPYALLSHHKISINARKINYEAKSCKNSYRNISRKIWLPSSLPTASTFFI